MISVHKNTELGEMSVYGNSKDLRDFSAWLKESKNGECTPLRTGTFAVEHNCVELHEARVNLSLGKLAASHLGNLLVIEGSTEAIHWLADYVNELANEPGFRHVHIGYYEGHPYVDKKHVEVVIVEM